MVDEIMAAVLQLVATVAVLLVTGHALPWLRTRVGVERLELLTLVAQEAYALVEARAPQLTAAGRDKLTEATGFADSWLRERGIRVSAAQIQAAIEQAWRELDPKGAVNTR